MKERGLLGLGVLLIAIACGPGTSPSGQPAMMTITEANFETLRQQFNDAKGGTRVIVLLSPT
jgi:hypothetical protein